MRKTMIMIGIVLACCPAKADKAYLGVCVEDAGPNHSTPSGMRLIWLRGLI